MTGLNNMKLSESIYYTSRYESYKKRQKELCFALNINFKQNCINNKPNTEKCRVCI